ncbi:MAG: hypothetical protein AAB345_04835 [Patescibacteria group bacterium]
MGRIVKLCREKAIDTERIAEIVYAESVRQRIAVETSCKYRGLRDPWVAGEFYSPVDWSGGSQIRKLILRRFPNWNSLGECGIALPKEVAEELELVSKLKIFPMINVLWAPNGEAFVVYGKLHDSCVKRFPIAYWGEEDYIAKVSAEAEALKSGNVAAKSGGLNLGIGMLVVTIMLAVIGVGAGWELLDSDPKPGEFNPDKIYASHISWRIGKVNSNFSVDYAKPISEAIDEVETKIEKVFFRTELENGSFLDNVECDKQVHNFAVLHFDEPGMTTQEVLGWMENEGWRPATLRELLVYVREFPDINKPGNLYALGSIGRASFSSGDCAPLAVPAFLEGGWLRPVHFYSGNEWSKSDFFLIVKK